MLSQPTESTHRALLVYLKYNTSIVMMQKSLVQEYITVKTLSKDVTIHGLLYTVKYFSTGFPKNIVLCNIHNNTVCCTLRTGLFCFMGVRVLVLLMLKRFFFIITLLNMLYILHVFFFEFLTFLFYLRIDRHILISDWSLIVCLYYLLFEHQQNLPNEDFLLSESPWL